jgi:hypothetical protein
MKSAGLIYGVIRRLLQIGSGISGALEGVAKHGSFCPGRRDPSAKRGYNPAMKKLLPLLLVAVVVMAVPAFASSHHHHHHHHHSGHHHHSHHNS